MDIYTDASLNDSQKIAGIGMVFVPVPGNPTGVIRLNGYVNADKIETAELEAIATALSKVSPENRGQIRIFTDSDKAMSLLLRCFQHPGPGGIGRIKDVIQKEILYRISRLFSKMPETVFSINLIRGHQARPEAFSDGYYNEMADIEAGTGRVNGEENRLNESRLRFPVITEISRIDENDDVAENSALGFPNIVFSFEGKKQKHGEKKTREEKGTLRRFAGKRRG